MLLRVVPANAGTPQSLRKAFAPVPEREDTAYGSRRAPGRPVEIWSSRRCRTDTAPRPASSVIFEMKSPSPPFGSDGHCAFQAAGAEHDHSEQRHAEQNREGAGDHDGLEAIVATKQHTADPDREHDSAGHADDGLIPGERARRRLWHDAIVQRRQEHGDEAKQIEMRMRRHQHEILPYAHDNAEDNADQAQ